MTPSKLSAYTPHMHPQRGFTLVELSIVLVILGLLIGGVLTGQSLIRAAELRSVSTQYQRYMTAVQTFRDKYFALPGDMTNAQSYWGVAYATQAGCVGTSTGDAKTCNGDGDGAISSSTGSNEHFRFWQHLANAGLIEGTYSGIQQGTTSASSTAANSPVGRISSSLWYANYANGTGSYSGTTFAFDGQYGNLLEIGGVTLNNDPITPILKPEDTYNIDMKVDDGKPGTGKLVIRTNTTWALQTCTDATASSQLSANYLLTSTALGCVLLFRQQF